MPFKDSSDDDDDLSWGINQLSLGERRGHRRSGSLSSPPETPCGFLVNRQDCAYGSQCVHSHSPDVIAAWNSKQGRSSCKHGPTCELVQRGICLYYHPESHRNRQSPRDKLMLKDLAGQQTIDIGSLQLGDRPVCISGEEELASFNKLGDDEILVPGLSLPT